jgi:hypothetical protein
MKNWIKNFLSEYGIIEEGVDRQLLFVLEEHFNNPQRLKREINKLVTNWHEQTESLYSEQLDTGVDELRNQISEDLLAVVKENEFEYNGRVYAFRNGELKEYKDKRWVYPFVIGMGWYMTYQQYNNPSLAERITLWQTHLNQNLSRIIYPEQAKYLAANSISNAIGGTVALGSETLYKAGTAFDVAKSAKRYNAKFTKTVMEANAITLLADAWRRTYHKALQKLNFVKGYRWELDPTHPDLGCECEAYASIDHGMGAGVFPIEVGVPNPPHHRCMCHITPVLKI